eukprot:2366714-Prymnesium_polylepis.1
MRHAVKRSRTAHTAVRHTSIRHDDTATTRAATTTRGTCCTPSANDHPPKADTDDKTHVSTLNLQSKHVLSPRPQSVHASGVL